jgi:hypothetical protein
VSSVAYSCAVRAVLTAAKRGVGREHGSDWRDATVRLLQSRSNSGVKAVLTATKLLPGVPHSQLEASYLGFCFIYCLINQETL